MSTLNANRELVKLRDLSSVFSRSAFVDILNYCDYSHFDWLVNQYSSSLNCTTYFDLIKKTYSIISKHYRCEYVYKNELIKLLLKEYGTKETVYFSEFRYRFHLLQKWDFCLNLASVKQPLFRCWSPSVRCIFNFHLQEYYTPYFLICQPSVFLISNILNIEI